MTEFTRVQNGQYKDQFGQTWVSIWRYRLMRGMNANSRQQLTKREGDTLAGKVASGWQRNEIMGGMVRVFRMQDLNQYYDSVKLN